MKSLNETIKMSHKPSKILKRGPAEMWLKLASNCFLFLF